MQNLLVKTYIHKFIVSFKFMLILTLFLRNKTYFNRNINFTSSNFKLIALQIFNKRSSILWSFFKNTSVFQKHKWLANKRGIWICIIYAINNNFRKQIATSILWQVGIHLTSRIHFILIFKRVGPSNTLT